MIIKKNSLYVTEIEFEVPVSKQGEKKLQKKENIKDEKNEKNSICKTCQKDKH